jgi:hypothetical protein
MQRRLTSPGVTPKSCQSNPAILVNLRCISTVAAAAVEVVLFVVAEDGVPGLLVIGGVGDGFGGRDPMDARVVEVG